MGHDFKPVTVGESIQVAILDELQQIRTLLEPSKPAEPAPTEPEPAAADEKPVPKPPAKKTAQRRKVTGQ